MLQFRPYYKRTPWGGRRLHEELGRPLPEGTIGESWELCDLDQHRSIVASGLHEGEALGDLWRAGALGGSARGEFPFLLKWLDTRDTLSIQVHPDAAVCERLGYGRPKTEAWLVANSDPGATLFLGHYPGLDADTLRQAAEGGTVHKWLYESRPRPGEMLCVPAGTLHAVGGGFLLLEVQQPSDTTFRVHDWGRVGDDGSPRELHLDAACQAVHYDAYGPPTTQRHGVAGPTFAMRRLRTGARLPREDLRVFVADIEPVILRSEGGGIELALGDVRVAEPRDGELTLAAGSCTLVTEPSDRREDS